MSSPIEKKKHCITAGTKKRKKPKKKALHNNKLWSESAGGRGIGPVVSRKCRKPEKGKRIQKERFQWGTLEENGVWFREEVDRRLRRGRGERRTEGSTLTLSKSLS